MRPEECIKPVEEQIFLQSSSCSPGKYSDLVVLVLVGWLIMRLLRSSSAIYMRQNGPVRLQRTGQ